MLKCLYCGVTYKEEINKTYCGCGGCYADTTNLYSTSIKNFAFEETPLIYSSDIGVYLKREDANLYSRTFKDRKTAFVLGRHNKFALASSGNQAISFGKYVLDNSIKISKTYLYVPPHIDSKKLEILKTLYSEINFTDSILSTEELTQGETDRWNITNGMDPIGASAYYSLAMELEKENFDYVFVPCGSGELYSSLSCYFHLLRKQEKIKIIPVQSKPKETDAIATKFVATQPFIDYFDRMGQHPYVIENSTETLKSLQSYSDKYNCELSSAVVFEAYDKMKPEGKTCLIITGAKK